MPKLEDREAAVERARVEEREYFLHWLVTRCTEGEDWRRDQIANDYRAHVRFRTAQEGERG